MTAETLSPETPVPDATAESRVDDFGMNWGELGGVRGGDDVETVEGDLEVLAQAPATEEVPAPIQAAEPAPTTAPVAAPPEQTAVPSPAPAPVPAIPPAVPVQPATPVPQPVPLQQAPVAPPQIDLAAWEASQLQELAKGYAITDADAERLQTEPELVLPQLAANMHMQVTKSILASVQSLIPQYLQHHTAQISAEQEARNAFYTVNPDLNNPQYEQAIMQVAQIYRAANKTAPREQAIKTIGDMVRMSLGLQSPQAAVAPAPTPSATAPAPFIPSRAGGAASKPIQQGNAWMELLDD